MLHVWHLHAHTGASGTLEGAEGGMCGGLVGMDRVTMHADRVTPGGGYPPPLPPPSTPPPTVLATRDHHHSTPLGRESQKSITWFWRRFRGVFVMRGAEGFCPPHTKNVTLGTSWVARAAAGRPTPHASSEGI